MHHATSGLLLSVLAVPSLAQVGSRSDLWDYSRGSVVAAHSGFDDTHTGYDARDVFGGAFHGYRPELGAVIFADHRPAGTVHWIEWRLSAPMDLERFTIACAADHYGEDLRGVSALRLLAREEAGATWILLHEAVRSEAEIVDHPLWVLEHEFGAACGGLVEFRAEFVQACGNGEYGGPRVIEMDGYGRYTWVGRLSDRDGWPGAGGRGPAWSASIRSVRSGPGAGIGGEGSIERKAGLPGSALKAALARGRGAE